MIEQGEFYLTMIGLFVLYIILNMRSHAKLLDLLDELAFPSNDPIMTSSLKEPVFEYEEEEPKEEEPEPEIFTEGLEPKEESEVRKASILYEVGDYTASGEATLRQIKGMRKDDVIGICEIHGLDTEGTKAQLIERIKENAA